MMSSAQLSSKIRGEAIVRRARSIGNVEHPGICIPNVFSRWLPWLSREQVAPSIRPLASPSSAWDSHMRNGRNSAPRLWVCILVVPSWRRDSGTPCYGSKTTTFSYNTKLSFFLSMNTASSFCHWGLLPTSFIDGVCPSSLVRQDICSF